MIDFLQDAKPVKFASQFGGFWTDQSNAKEILAGKLELGSITEQQAEMLSFWIENGYIIIPNAVDASILDRVEKDIDKVYAGELGPCFVETFETGKMQVIPVEQRHRSFRNKVLDIYAISEATRDAIFAPKITEFLNLVFDRPAMAMQGLYFELGSQQEVHQDSAYVRVDSPMEFAASWIALEDIVPGSGELEYIPGSHKIKEYLFDGNSKWLTRFKLNAEFISQIQVKAAEMGLKSIRFLPKRGDALIWSADLAHGGSPAAQPERTRRSLVTHYCPSSATPMYFKTADNSGKIKLDNGQYIAYCHHNQPKPAPAQQDNIEISLRQPEVPSLVSKITRKIKKLVKA